MYISTTMLLDYNPTQGKVADGRAYKTRQPLPPLNRWVQSYWQLTVSKGQFQYHSVPDNCVDWIINLGCFDDNFFIPPFLSSTLFHIDGPASFFGIRFRILGHKGLISLPLGEWGEAGSVKAEDLLPADIVYTVFEAIDNAKSFDKRCYSLSAVILSAITFADVDPRLARYIRYCYENVSSNLDLSDSQSSKFGVSARQLRRLAKQHVGLLPKDFGKVLRFQSALKAMNAPQNNKTYLDYYYDQPHFVREFKRLSGVTPTQFRKMSVLYNHYSSE
ncbi:transcriptional regulator, AraC family [Shewanella denitrificans OS217]|uniref:Transcriptional regulator, AraC family n=2 Tax=Shewanella TaxID=22 RepID=Q12MW2_SHEDO|nr:transcriptional regulator, AraC family [Shewanella denitrificans OS217]